jgi:iron complex outermembrane recepter protein
MSAAQGRDRPTPCAGERHTERTVSWGNRVNYKRNLLSLALASATMMLAAQVHAQAQQPPPADQDDQDEEEASATELDRVVVTGIRASIEESIETKRQETGIVEAVSAEDIGKLPDVSIADSIARLPGLTAQRFGGRAQEINIRGFSGDFSTTLLNGREQVSLGNNRGVEFDQYPSELMSSVVVYKTQNADIVGQGLSGTVDLRTVRPLAFGERAVAVNARGDMNRLGDDSEYGNRFSISYIDQFADNTVGLALGYARLNNPAQTHQFESWGYNGGGFMDGGKVYDIAGDNTRDGVMGVLEYQPNDFWNSTLDLFYSQFDKDEAKRGLEYGIGLDWSGATATNVQRNQNGTVTSADIQNLPVVVLRNDTNFAHDELRSVGWRNEFDFAGDWKIMLDLSHSSATREERILETYAGVPGPRDSLSYRFNPEGYFDLDFGYDYDDPNILRLFDPGGWGQDGYIKDFEVKDRLNAARLHFERAFLEGAFSSVEFGANLTDRYKSRASDEAFLCLQDCRDGAQAPVPAPTTRDFNFAGIGSLYGYDALNALNTIYNRKPNSHPDISNKNWEVDEEVLTGYVQVNIDTEFLGAPLRGNVGVQAVSVDQSSTGVATFGGVPVSEPATGGATYTDYLPSLNLKLELPYDLLVRFGIGRQMARPRMDQLRANAGFSYDRTKQEFSGGGGNPELRPWIANAVDLTVEKYFGVNGYVSGGVFFKKLQSYIFEQSTAFDYSKLPTPPGAIPPDAQPTSFIGQFNQPINGEGGDLQGMEFAVSIPFDLLWQPLRGFGFTGNYSVIDSDIRPNGPGTSDRLPGLSKYIWNATLYFEQWGFSARLSQRSRSDFRGEVQGFGGNRFIRDFKGQTVTDFQMGYGFQSGPLENLSFLLQVYNLENEPDRATAAGFNDRPREYFEFGRTYLLGVNYRF